MSTYIAALLIITGADFVVLDKSIPCVTLQHDARTFDGCFLGPDRILTTSEDGTITTWNASGKRLDSFTVGGDLGYLATYSDTVAVTTSDATLRLFQLSTKKLLWTVDAGKVLIDARSILNATDDTPSGRYDLKGFRTVYLRGVWFSKDGGTVIVESIDHVLMFSALDGSLQRIWKSGFLLDYCRATDMLVFVPESKRELPSRSLTVRSLSGKAKLLRVYASEEADWLHARFSHDGATLAVSAEVPFSRQKNTSWIDILSLKDGAVSRSLLNGYKVDQLEMDSQQLFVLTHAYGANNKAPDFDCLQIITPSVQTIAHNARSRSRSLHAYRGKLLVAGLDKTAVLLDLSSYRAK